MAKQWTTQRVKRLRATLGLSLAAMGKRAGVSDVTYLRWETGESPVNERTARILDAIEASFTTPTGGGPLTASSSETYVHKGNVYIVPMDDSPLSRSVRALLEAHGAKSGSVR